MCQTNFFAAANILYCYNCATIEICMIDISSMGFLQVSCDQMGANYSISWLRLQIFYQHFKNCFIQNYQKETFPVRPQTTYDIIIFLLFTLTLEQARVSILLILLSWAAFRLKRGYPFKTPSHAPQSTAIQ